MMSKIEVLKSEYDALISKAESLKTNSAKSKKYDKAREVALKISFEMERLLPEGTVLINQLYCHDAMNSGLGSVKNAKVIQVYTHEIVASVNTKEYPEGEVIKIPFNGSYFGDKNFLQIVNNQ